ncbi:hypothetical protein KEJ34_00980 [Candidatus Bathyarchaeota archaeon]|nr:hypothetical protein [Candidatus Bathyarchaeota archaeon]
MAKKRITGKLCMQVKACPKPPPRNFGAIIRDVILMRDLRRSIFLYFWLLTNIFAANELIIKPLFTAQSIAPSAAHIADQIVRVVYPLDRPFYFESNAISINFTLPGNLRGYRIRAHIAFAFSCISENSEGFCRLNITALLNNKEFFRLTRDEEIISSEGSHGIIEIPINERGGRVELMAKNNTLVLLITVSFSLDHYEKGFADIKVGPVILIAESLDADVDGILDPADNLEGNNRILFLILSALPLVPAIIAEKLRLNSKDERRI